MLPDESDGAGSEAIEEATSSAHSSPDSSATSSGGGQTPRFIYCERQRRQNLEYARAYRIWLEALPPEERARLDELGVGRPDVPDRSHNKYPHRDIERFARVTWENPEKSDGFMLALSEALSEFSHWLIFPPGQRGLNAKAIGQRVIMAMWIMRPDIIGNLSLPEIGALVDARPEVLSRQARAFSDRFGIRGRAQFTDATRAAQSAAKLSPALERDARATIEKGEVNGLN